MYTEATTFKPTLVKLNELPRRKLNARHPDVLLKTIKIYKYRQNTTKFYYTLLLLDYMFRLLGVIIRSSCEIIVLDQFTRGPDMTPRSRNM